MEAVKTRPPGGSPKQFLSTRKGAWTVAAIAATVGGLVLLVFINQYKKDVSASLAPAPVLTADRLIPQGTAGNEVIAGKLFKATALATEDIKPGAITQAAEIQGRTAIRTVLPGEQITAADFALDGDPIRSRLTRTERAIQIPVDKIHGLLATLRAGDRVDILAAFNSTNQNGSGTPTLQPLTRDVRVMAVSTGSVILETTDRQGTDLAFAADNAKLWFLLRPPVGAKDSNVGPVTQDSIASRTSREEGRCHPLPSAPWSRSTGKWTGARWRVSSTIPG